VIAKGQQAQNSHSSRNSTAHNGTYGRVDSSLQAAHIAGYGLAAWTNRGRLLMAGSIDRVPRSGRWIVTKAVLAGAILAMVMAACGGSMTADEYVEDLNAVVATGRSDFEAAAAAYDQAEDPTLADEVAFLEQEIAVRRVFLDGFEALDPPEPIADVHRLLGDAFVRLTVAAEDLAASAGSVSTFEEAEQTSEFAEYLAANADGAAVCLDVQAKLDSLVASDDEFTDVPWISGLGLAVQAALGCGEIETG
jgi:hypothetical protein